MGRVCRMTPLCRVSSLAPSSCCWPSLVLLLSTVLSEEHLTVRLPPPRGEGRQHRHLTQDRNIEQSRVREPSSRVRLQLTEPSRRLCPKSTRFERSVRRPSSSERRPSLDGVFDVCTAVCRATRSPSISITSFRSHRAAPQRFATFNRCARTATQSNERGQTSMPGIDLLPSTVDQL
jgi:hypothetical protein